MAANLLVLSLAGAADTAHVPQPCEEIPHIEGLPPEAPRVGTVITVDVSTNTAYLFRDGNVVVKGPAATGTDRYMKKGLRRWLFRTPRGRHQVKAKVVDPVWIKPDWAFIEEGLPIPPYNSPSRRIRGKLGKYALHLGEGIMIHGTNEPESVGKKASHGCIRLRDKTMQAFYKAARIGTDVYIFDSKPQPATWLTEVRASLGGKPLTSP